MPWTVEYVGWESVYSNPKRKQGKRLERFCPRLRFGLLFRALAYASGCETERFGTLLPLPTHSRSPQFTIRQDWWEGRPKQVLFES